MKAHVDSGKPILKIIESLYDKMKDSGICDQNRDRTIARLKPELTKVSRFFQCTLEEAMFFSVIFGLKVVSSSVYYNDMISYMNCNPFYIVGNEHIFKSLQKKRLITRDDNWGRSSASLNITREAYNAVTSNKPPGTVQTHFENMYALLQNVDNLILERRRETISTYELFEEIQAMMTAEMQMSLIRNLQKTHLNIRETTLLLYMCFHFANGDEYVDLNEMLNMVFDMMGEKVSMKKDLINKTADLVKKNFVEFENDYFLMGRSIKLTDFAIETIFEEEAEIFEKKKTFRPSNASLIEHYSIKSKELFFNKEENNQLLTLYKLMDNSKLNAVMEKFEQAGMPKGIVVLFYGEPGTGKTESVFKLASQTMRHILMVDIAGIKDKYVGESEKHIKQIFDNYKKALEYFPAAPILLFNESDALISKRIEVTSSVDQMNNAMQNILLQELESFEGILFATSNLNVNLDKAFERRFLYKIQFKKPDIETRLHIWKSKLPDTDESILTKLAKNYEFTGGQIDNVARKYFLENIINEITDYQVLEELCQTESFGENVRIRMGF
jgi:AAA+ superfamily predicted ATPase